MDIPFLKKYKPMIFADFFIEKLLIKLLKTLIKMDSLNILLIGNSGSGKTSILDATIREYYGIKKIPKYNVLYINSLKEQGIQYYRNEVKTFCQTICLLQNKKKFVVSINSNNVLINIIIII